MVSRPSAPLHVQYRWETRISSESEKRRLHHVVSERAALKAPTAPLGELLGPGGRQGGERRHPGAGAEKPTAAGRNLRARLGQLRHPQRREQSEVCRAPSLARSGEGAPTGDPAGWSQ